MTYSLEGISIALSILTCPRTAVLLFVKVPTVNTSDLTATFVSLSVRGPEGPGSGRESERERVSQSIVIDEESK